MSSNEELLISAAAICIIKKKINKKPKKKWTRSWYLQRDYRERQIRVSNCSIMDSHHVEPSERNTSVKKTSKNKRFSLSSKNTQDIAMKDNTLNPIKVNSFNTKSSNSILVNMSAKQYQVRRSVLRQFDPLLEKFGNNEEKQQIIPSCYTESVCYDKKLITEEHSQDLSSKNVLIGKVDVSNVEQEAREQPSSMGLSDKVSRLPTIEEMSVEDITEASSIILSTSGITLVEVNDNVPQSSTKYLASYLTDIMHKVPPNMHGRFFEKNVQEISPCSSCSSYNSTLEEFTDSPSTLPLYDEKPLRAQHYLYQELSLENELYIGNLKSVHERNKATKTMKETYEKHLENKLTELVNFRTSHQQMNSQLAMGEDAFSNLHSKYNKAKQVIDDFHKNERDIKKISDQSVEVSKKCMEKYQLLDEYAKVKLIAFRKVADEESKIFEKDLKMMQATTKHLHIKVSSLEQQLAQKRKECQELHNLYSEIIAD